MGYLVGVNKTLNNHFAQTSEMVCSNRVQIEAVNPNTMQRNLEVAFCDLKLENRQLVELCLKKWRSQFVSSKHPKSLRSQFATLETRFADHFREVTKMIACGRNFRPQNHFVGINKMMLKFGGMYV